MQLGPALSGPFFACYRRGGMGVRGMIPYLPAAATRAGRDRIQTKGEQT